MRRSLVICLVLLVLGSTLASAEQIVKPNARVAVCGDSITE